MSDSVFRENNNRNNTYKTHEKLNSRDDTRFTSNDNQGSSELNDLASKVEWTPIAGGGSNFKTSYLYKSNQSRIEVLKY